MAIPRLTGPPVQWLARLLALGPAARAVFALSARDFGIPQLAALPAEARGPLPDLQQPVPGRAPHTWEDQGLGIPRAHRPTFASLATAYRTGVTDPAQVVESILRAAVQGPFGHATHSPFVTLAADRARRAAAASRARWADGEPLGPLDGMPVPIKDELDMEGLPTLGGTSYRTEPASSDAWLVRQLEAAGAVVIGKTHATEWGLNPCGMNPHHAMPRNVWHPDRAAGGSSTGTGAAVALGMAPAGIGSDGGGSIRIPAALQGIYGLKPTYVRIGRTGNPWGSGTVAHLGPLAGTPADLVELLLAVIGPDPADPTTHLAPDGHDVAEAWRAALGRGVRGARIGIVPGAWAEADPAVARVCREALDALVSAGATLVEVQLPLLPHASAIGSLTIGAETVSETSDDAARHMADFSAEYAILWRILSRLPAADVLRAARTRTVLRQQTAALFRDRVDLLAFPTTGTTAPVYRRSEDHLDVLDLAGTEAMTRFSFLANLTGLPAGTAPAGRVGGLPVGLQLVGDAWDEASVIAALAAVQRSGVADLGLPEAFLDLHPPGLAPA